MNSRFHYRHELVEGPVERRIARRISPPDSKLATSLKQHIAGAVQINDVWIEQPLPGGWVAAYRLGVRKRSRPQTTILELRIFPDEPKRAPGEWSAKLWGAYARPAKTPFSHRLLQSLQRADLEGEIDKLVARFGGTPAHAAILGMGNLPAPRRGRSGGRKGESAKFYKEFAERYRTVEGPERSAQGFRSTRKVLAAEYGKPESTIVYWIRRARALGYLAQTNRGRRGG